jgi:hypothetical protein
MAIERALGWFPTDGLWKALGRPCMGGAREALKKAWQASALISVAHMQEHAGVEQLESDSRIV